jgi:hypothetical protein
MTILDIVIEEVWFVHREFAKVSSLLVGATGAIFR